MPLPTATFQHHPDEPGTIGPTGNEAVLSEGGDHQLGIALKIGDLQPSGLRLAMRCRSCARFRYLRPDRYDKGQLLSAIRLKCTACRSDDVDAIAAKRDSASGFWPAESS